MTIPRGGHAKGDDILSGEAIQTGANDVIDMIAPLHDDAMRALEQADSTDIFNRRVAFRTVFASIEGSLSLLRHLLLADASRFDAGEITLLRQCAYSLDDKGRMKEKVSFQGLPQTCRFILSMCAREAHVPSTCSYEDGGWNAFLLSTKIRNRLLHPKTPTDLDVTSEESTLLSRAYTWFRQAKVKSLAEMLISSRVQSFIILERKLPLVVLQAMDIKDLSKLHTSADRPNVSEWYEAARLLDGSGLFVLDQPHLPLTQAGIYHAHRRRSYMKALPVEMAVSKVVARALHGSGIHTLADALLISDEQLLQVRGVGPRSVSALRRTRRLTDWNIARQLYRTRSDEDEVSDSSTVHRRRRAKNASVLPS